MLFCSGYETNYTSKFGARKFKLLIVTPTLIWVGGTYCQLYWLVVEMHQNDFFLLLLILMMSLFDWSITQKKLTNFYIVDDESFNYFDDLTL